MIGDTDSYLNTTYTAVYSDNRLARIAGILMLLTMPIVVIAYACIYLIVFVVSMAVWFTVAFFLMATGDETVELPEYTDWVAVHLDKVINSFTGL